MEIWRMRIACWITKAKKHTLSICKTCCFPTATMVARTRHIVTLYLQYIACLVTWPVGQDTVSTTSCSEQIINIVCCPINTGNHMPDYTASSRKQGDTQISSSRLKLPRFLTGFLSHSMHISGEHTKLDQHRFRPDPSRFIIHLPPHCSSSWGASGSAVSSSTALQTGRLWVRFPMVSLEFFIDIILPASLWLWGRLSL